MTIGRITLAPPERRELQRRARSRSLSAEDNKRARLMLLVAKGLSFSEICRRLDCTDRYISVWKRRFEQERLKGLDSRYRGSQRRVRTAEMEAKILEATRKGPSDATTHWSSYRLAKHLGVSHTTVYRVWRQFGIQPHRLRRYMASDDPQFEEKAADVIGLYLNPPEHGAVFSLDEKSAIQALDRLDPCCRFPRVGPSGTALSITGTGLFLCTRRSTRAPVKCWAKPLLAIPAWSSSSSWAKSLPANPKRKKSTSSPTT